MLILTSIMKKSIMTTIAAISGIVLVACNSSSSSSDKALKTDTAKSTMMASVKYTCRMHPEVISDTLGKCPKCGMEMVPMKDSTLHMNDSMMK